MRLGKQRRNTIICNTLRTLLSAGEELLADAALAPSVGYSQPWRFAIVETAERRAAVMENFRRCNQDALAAYAGDRAKLYASLKLAGLAEAPVHLAVFCDEGTAVGRGLGLQRRRLRRRCRRPIVAGDVSCCRGQHVPDPHRRLRGGIGAVHRDR